MASIPLIPGPGLRFHLSAPVHTHTHTLSLCKCIDVAGNVLFQQTHQYQLCFVAYCYLLLKSLSLCSELLFGFPSGRTKNGELLLNIFRLCRIIAEQDAVSSVFIAKIYKFNQDYHRQAPDGLPAGKRSSSFRPESQCLSGRSGGICSRTGLKSLKLNLPKQFP